HGGDRKEAKRPLHAFAPQHARFEYGQRRRHGQPGRQAPCRPPAALPSRRAVKKATATEETVWLFHSALDSGDPQERLLVGRAPEELLEQLLRLLGLSLGEDRVAIHAPGRGIEHALFFEAREHIGGEDLAPQIAVIAAVISAQQMA